jgi:restriction system protein
VLTVPIPDVQTIMLPVLRHLAEHQWGTSDLVIALADEFTLTPEERNKLLPSRRQAIFANRVHWALAHLKGAELISRVSRGEYVATDAGHNWQQHLLQA